MDFCGFLFTIIIIELVIIIVTIHINSTICRNSPLVTIFIITFIIISTKTHSTHKT